jgi:hypothetical protein
MLRGGEPEREEDLNCDPHRSGAGEIAKSTKFVKKPFV